MPPVGDQGFTAVPIFVWKRFQGPLSLFCLLRYRGDNVTGESWYAHESMAEDLGASTSSVRRWLQELVDQNLVTVERRVTDLGKQGTNLYRVVGVLDGCSDLDTLGYSNLSTLGCSDLDNEIRNKDLLLQEDLNTKKNYVSDSFDEFWKVYPHKINKAPARKAWDKAVKKVGADHLIERVTAFANDPNLPDKQFICHASTWLNQERWDNEPFPARDGGSRRASVDPNEEHNQAVLRQINQRIREEQEGNTDEAK